MGIVTFNALYTGIVPFWINAGDALAFTRRVWQIGVAAQTKLASTVNVQFFRIIGMLLCRSVAVFAGDYAVKLFRTDFDDIPMAFTAVFMHSFTTGSSIFRRLIFPFRFIGLTVKRVHKASFTRSKVVWYIEEAKHQ